MKLSEIKELLKEYNLHPSKGLGQNFLIDKGVLQKIIETAELKPNEVVLEIGPGLGNLTIELAKKVKKVIAIEKDPKMVDILRETLKEFKNIEIIQADILKIKNWKLIENCKLKAKSARSSLSRCDSIIENYKVVANLPYYITSPVIRKFLEIKNQPNLMVLMVQKEVAQRICAHPPKMSLLAVSVQFYAEPEIIDYVSKKSFWPQPKVDSAILKISNIKNQKSKIFCDLFFKIVKAGFSQPRKQLVNNLSRGLKMDKEKVKNWLLKNSIQSTQRAETLTLRDWFNLTLNFHS